MRYQAIVKTAQVAALVTLVELLVLVNGVDVICEELFVLGFIAALLAYMQPLKATPVLTFFVECHFVSPIGCKRTLFTHHQLVWPWLCLKEAKEL